MNRFKLGINLFLSLAIIAVSIWGLVYTIQINQAKYYLYWSIFVWVSSALFSIVVYFSTRHAEVKANWILIFIILPMIGPITFVLFGLFPFKRIKRKKFLFSQNTLIKHESFDASKKLYGKDGYQNFAYALNNAHRPIYLNNSFRAIKGNASLFNESIDLVRKAKKFIHIETYCIGDGLWTRALFTELAKKAKAGVKVRILYDWIGSYRMFKNKTLKTLKQCGVEIGCFNKEYTTYLSSSINFRNHRKALIVDNKAMIVGGSNLADEYLGIGCQDYAWRDQNFMIEGEIVNSVNIIFSMDWFTYTGKTISKGQKQEVINQAKKYLKPYPVKGKKNTMQVIEYSPIYSDFSLRQMFIKFIYQARKEILISSPYFFISEEVKDALKTASASGVKITILTPSKSDKFFTTMVNQGNYEELMNFGVEVYEYEGFIHSKTFIIDDEYCIIGSSNFDYRSFCINFESGILIKSKPINQIVKQIYKEDLSRSHYIAKMSLIKQTRWLKWLVSPLLHIFYEML